MKWLRSYRRKVCMLYRPAGVYTLASALTFADFHHVVLLVCVYTSGHVLDLHACTAFADRSAAFDLPAREAASQLISAYCAHAAAAMDAHESASSGSVVLAALVIEPLLLGEYSGEILSESVYSSHSN